MDGTAEWTGTLAETPVAEILGRLSREKRSGVLTVRGADQVEIFLASGELVCAESKEPGSRFADLLLEKGLIQGLDIEEIREDSDALPPTTMAERLVEKGLISQQVVRAELASYSIDQVGAMIARAHGKFSFEDRPPAFSGESGLRAPLSVIILDAVRRMPEGDPFVERLGDLSFPAASAPALDGVAQSLCLTAEEAYLLSLCDGTIALKDILRMGPSRPKTAHVVYSLVASGLVEIKVPRPVPPPSLPPEPDRPKGLPESFAVEMHVPREGADEQARLEVARRGYLEARKLIEQKDYYGAIVLLNESVRLCPDNSEYRYRLAGALSRNPHWRERALHQYAEAVKLDPLRQELLREYAELLAESRRFGEALVIARRLLEKYPEELRNKLLVARCENGVAENPPEKDGPAGKSDSSDSDAEKSGSLLSRFFRRGTKPE